MAFTFDAIFAADPNNAANVASNAAITIFDPNDPGKAPITITDPTDSPISNPITVNKNGFGPAFKHATLDRVGWSGGGFEGFFTSYEGIKNVAVAAQEAAEAAGATAAAEAAAGVAEVANNAAAAEAAAEAAATAAANSAALVNAPADTAIATAINATGSATKTALTSTYRRITGMTFAVFGDSLANNGEGVAYWLAALSRQMFCFPDYSYVVSRPGYTSASMVPLVTEITGLNPLPSYCFISAGSNDAGSGVDPDTYMANVESICDAFVAAGVQPILMTIPPRINTYGILAEYNLRLGRYAARKGFFIVDAYSVLADPATGQPLASLTNDNIHPNAAGCKAVAAKAVEDLGPRFPKPFDVTSLAITAANIFPNGSLIVDSNADGIAEGSSATLSTGFTASLVTDPAGFKWQRANISGATGDKKILGPNIIVPATQASTTLTSAAVAGATSVSLAANVAIGTYKLTNAQGQYEYVRILSTSGTGPYTATLWTVTPLKFNHAIGDTIEPAISVGDRLALAVRVSSGQDGGNLAWQVSAYNGSSTLIANRILTSPNTGLSRQLTNAACYHEFVVPAGTATLQFSMTVAPVNGTYDYAMPLMYNLTKAA